MKLVILALVLGIAAAPKAAAVESVPAPLQLKPKSKIALTTSASAAAHSSAPFVAPLASEPELDLLPRRDLRQDQSRSSCNSERAVCYDPSSGRIEFRPARNLMPDLPGLQRETISVKRDRIVFRYSF
jgi:hypothetical protein